MMNMWICAILLIAVYCTIAGATGACGGSTRQTYQTTCSMRIAFPGIVTYSSCHRFWFWRTCYTRYRVVNKYKNIYYCKLGFTKITMRLSTYCYIKPVACGISKYPNAGAEYISPNIVGGKEARMNEFPWQVSLHMPGKLCGGIILNATTILTAAHCVSGVADGKVRVNAGDHNLRAADSTEQVRTSQSLLIHPNYNKNTIYNDVALVTLSMPLILHADVRAACLPAKTFSVTDKDVVISGWGRVSTAGAIPCFLQYAVVRVVPQSTCKTRAADVLCVSDARGDKVRSACFGDSGGPMVIKSGSKWYVVGVTSYVSSSRGCAGGDPFGYRSVMYHNDFIRYGKVTQSA